LPLDTTTGTSSAAITPVPFLVAGTYALKVA
jgi:hypothetical protein